MQAQRVQLQATRR